MANYLNLQLTYGNGSAVSCNAQVSDEDLAVAEALVDLIRDRAKAALPAAGESAQPEVS